jgi:hypothetical protein
VDAASAGDVVLVTNGVYKVSSQLMITNGVILRSVNGPNETCVNGPGGNGDPNPWTSCRCLYISGTNAIVDGFTFRNGQLCEYDVSAGGWAYLVGGVLMNCVVENNKAGFTCGSVTAKGAGIYCENASSLRTV